MEGNVAQCVLHSQHRIEDIKHPEGTEHQKQYDNEQADRLRYQQPLYKIIPLYIKKKIQELRCIEEEEAKYDDQDQLEEKKIEVVDDPLCRKIIPMTDLVHEILKTHFYLPVLRYLNFVFEERRTVPCSPEYNLGYTVLVNSTLNHSRRKKEFGILRIISCFFLFLAVSIRGEAADKMRVHFLNAGYADAILVEWPPDNAVLVDAGDAEDAPDILNYLRSAGVSRLAAMVITHPHKNHFGGAQAIAERMKVGQVFINGDMNAEDGYQDLLDFLKNKAIPVAKLRRGDSLPGMPDGVSWNIIHPGELSGDVNGNSLVSLIRFRKTAVLLTGDIMVPAQEALLRNNPSLRDAQCVQIPHHGGQLSKDFLSFFSKAQFIISTGANLWGLPEEEVLAQVAGKVFRTDSNGTIVVESDGEKIKISPVNNAGV